MRYLLLLFILLSFASVQAQSTCNDPNATNYKADAPCAYPTTKRVPKRITKLLDALNETSGLIQWEGNLWTLNDGGDAPRIYQLDAQTFDIQRIVRIKNVDNNDWEELAQDEAHIYIGDFGNNKGSRKDLAIYQIKKSDLKNAADTVVTPKVISFYYPEQKRFDRRGDHHFDCEGFFYYQNQLHLFTKNRDNAKTYHYTINPNGERETAKRQAAVLRDSFDVGGLITAATISNGKVVLLGYTPQKLFLWMMWDFSADQFFSGNCRRIELGRFIWRGQMEAVCFDKDSQSVFISAEAIKYKKQHLRKLDLGEF